MPLVWNSLPGAATFTQSSTLGRYIFDNLSFLYWVLLLYHVINRVPVVLNFESGESVS